MTPLDWIAGILLAAIAWGALFGVAAHRDSRRAHERRELRRAAERAAGGAE